MKKRILAIVLFLALAIGLTACGGSENESIPKAENESVPKAENDNIPQINKTEYSTVRDNTNWYYTEFKSEIESTLEFIELYFMAAYVHAGGLYTGGIDIMEISVSENLAPMNQINNYVITIVFNHHGDTYFARCVVTNDGECSYEEPIQDNNYTDFITYIEETLSDTCRDVTINEIEENYYKVTYISEQDNTYYSSLYYLFSDDMLRVFQK